MNRLAAWWARPTVPVQARAAMAVPGTATAAVFLAASQLNRPEFLPLGCLTLAPILVALVSRPNLFDLRVLTRLPERATVGETVTQGLVVRNTGRTRTPPVLLSSEVPGFAPLTLAVPPLAPGADALLEVPRQAVSRAWSDRQQVRISTTEPFGLIERETVLTLDRQTFVHPAPAAAEPVPAGGGDGDRPLGPVDRAGTQPHAVREWRPGDSLRQVHWRSTARHGSPVVVEPERMTGRRLAVLVCGSGQQDPARYEALLARTAATVVEALRGGDEVLLLAIGPVGRAIVPRDGVSALDWFSRLRWRGPQEALDPQPDAGVLLHRVRDWTGPHGSLLLAALDPDQRLELVRGAGADPSLPAGPDRLRVTLVELPEQVPAR